MTRATEEMNARVKALWLEGHPASEIAVAINTEFGGARTRSAILGMVHRMKLRDGTVRRSPAHRSEPSAPPARKRAAKAPSPERHRAAKAVPLPPMIPSPVPPPVVVKHDGPAGGVPLSQAAARDCRWPVAGAGAGMMICGARQQDGSSFCPAHHRIAYVPTEKRRAA